VAVRAGDELVGLGPFFAPPPGRGRVDYRLLGAGFVHRLSPLARPGREAEVARGLARALAGARPRPHMVALEGISRSSPWPGLLASGWPRARGAARYEMAALHAPVVALDAPDFEAWLAAKSSNFRQQVRRGRRALEREGAVLRRATADTVTADVDAFLALHLGRWEGRGGSSLEGDVAGMLVDAAGELLGSDRLRLWMLECGDRAISAQLFIEAGGELLYWNGGFDEEWARHKPALQTIVAALEDALARGERRLDLGGGDSDYKRRLASGDDPLVWVGVVPRDARYPISRALLAPKQAATGGRRLARRLPRRLQDVLRRARRAHADADFGRTG
jgi:CelD/BcsL family acetyltransferase involved in cellulose biosynthesis